MESCVVELEQAGLSFLEVAGLVACEDVRSEQFELHRNTAGVLAELLVGEVGNTCELVHVADESIGEYLNVRFIQCLGQPLRGHVAVRHLEYALFLQLVLTLVYLLGIHSESESRQQEHGIGEGILVILPIAHDLIVCVLQGDYALDVR